MTINIDRVIKTDVLSIGGSGAGITSAIYASRKGVKVTLVSKGKLGYSGNAIMAGGGFGIDGESAFNDLGLKEADQSFTKEKMFDCIVKESYYMADQNMVHQYVYESPIVIKEYLGWAERSNQDFLFMKPANWISSGLCFTKTLLQGLKEAENIDILEDVTIVNILTKDNNVTGAIGLDIYSGEIILFECKSIIIGTGGYQPFSRKNTVSDMTGDGVAMAYRAGAKLADMEFILAFPTAVVPHNMKGSIYPYVFEYNMRNLNFEIRDKNFDLLDIPDEIIKISRGGKLSKLVSTYYFGHAMEKGLEGPNCGFFYDYSSNSREEKEKGFNTFYSRFGRWHKHGCYKGESLKEIEKMIYEDIPIEVGLGFEYCMGGIEVNAKMETSVNGLYAGGEVTSGVFGANRVGDGLVEMMCQGMRAGLSAAEYSNNISSENIVKGQLDEYLQDMFKYFDNKDGVSPIKIHSDIEAVCDEGFSFIRSEDKLVAALNGILDIRDKLENAVVSSKSRKYNNEWLWAIQAQNLLVCCEAGIRAAILRKESRGCHIRKDYPMVNNDDFMIKYIICQENGKMEISERRPITTAYDLPTGKVNNVIDYFLDSKLNYSR